MPDQPLPFERRLGAFPLGDGHAGFRVWAPRPERVEPRGDGREHPPEPGGRGGYEGVALPGDGRDAPLEPVGLGVYEAVVEAEPGADYEYLLDGAALPDPCSR